MTIRTLLVALMTLGLFTIWGCGSSSSGSGDRSLCAGCPTDALRISCENSFNACDIIPIESVRQACYIEATQQFGEQGCN